MAQLNREREKYKNAFLKSTDIKRIQELIQIVQKELFDLESEIQDIGIGVRKNQGPRK